MKTSAASIFTAFLIMAVAGFSCNRSPEGTSSGKSPSIENLSEEVRVEMESISGASFEVAEFSLESGDGIVKIPADNWVILEVPIQVAGRYRTELRLSGGPELSCWVEDYIENKDERTYNVTGSMNIPARNDKEQFVLAQVDGTPLNSGVHKMKLHIQGGDARVDWIQFTLLKKHRPSPESLTQNMDGDQWVVVWSDEFEEGDLPDPDKWTYDLGDWGWGNNELQYYTEGRKENARIENGNLIIEAHKNPEGERWTSARLTTRGKTSFVYGRIEMRAKVPVGKGNWTAGWTLGDKYVDELSWPYCGEIDILECVGFEIDDETGDGLHHASVHCGAYYFKLNNQPTGITEVTSMNTEYHLYAIEWTPESIKAFVDEKHYFTYEDTSDSLTWPFDEPQNIILNLAMGGGWGGAQGMDESLTTQQVVIDYVRVYERK